MTPDEEGMAPDTGPLPLEVATVLGPALERVAARAFKAANRAGQEKRDNLYGLSMSSLGGCTRQAVYRLAGAEPSDPELAVDAEARQAMIGTWIHEGFLPHFADGLRKADIEFPVEMSVRAPGHGGRPTSWVRIKGRLDCYDHGFGGGVIDLKTLAAYMLGGKQHSDVTDAHRHQVRGYATALRQMGLPVAWIAWLYMDRSTGEVLVHIEPFGQDEADQTEAHVRELWRIAEAPDHAPRGERGPGLSWVCDGCPWLRRCWGPDAEPGDTGAIAVHDREEIAFAAQKYRELAAEIKPLEEEQDAYGAMVGRPKPGRYGEMVITYQRDGEELHGKKAKSLLEEHGIEVPMRPRRGNRLIRWAVEEET